MTAAPPRRRPSAVVPAAPHRAARESVERAERRARTRRRVGQAVLVLLPLLAVAWVLLLSTWLAVDRVDVRGVSRLSADEVRAAVRIAPDTPLARVDTRAVERAVAELDPVAQVEASRSWPGTLRIAVRERTAAAGVLQDGGVTLVDAAGVPFATEPTLPDGVVRLQVTGPGPDDPATLAALTVHRDLPPALRERVRIVRAVSASSVVLLLDTGKQVVWGAPGGTRSKAAAAEALLRMPGDVFDVSAPGVVVRRQAASSAP